jgi:hypothetical protein
MEDLLILILKFLKAYDDYILSGIVTEQVIKEKSKQFQSLKELYAKIKILLDIILRKKELNEHELAKCLICLHFYFAYFSFLLDEIHDLVNMRRIFDDDDYEFTSV